ncbi:MAG: calcium-binding protein [Pseudomonadota bacterium]
MADVILTTDTTTAQTLTSSNDVYFLAEGVLHYTVSGGEPLQLADSNAGLVVGMEVIILGTLAALGSTGALYHLSATDDVANASILVGSTGKVIGNSAYRGIDIDSDDTLITNNGEITGGEAIRTSGDDNRIYSTGLISGTYDGASTIYTLIMTGENNEFVNTGTVTGRQGVRFQDDSFMSNSGIITTAGRAVYSNTSSFETMELVNSGTITGGTESFYGESGDDTVRNSGTMEGGVVLGSGTNVVENTGLIRGDVTGGSSVDTVENSGTINGDVKLGSNADTLVISGNGLITGDALGEAGNDTMTGGNNGDNLNGGADNDEISGRGGDDTLLGDSGSDTLEGGGGDDSLDGGSDADDLSGDNGNDTLTSGSGDDTLYGGNGDDDLDGGRNNDSLFGGRGNDALVGGLGNDVLRGGSGNDVLQGGEGKDVMRGDLGADTFVFATPEEMGVFSNRDRVTRFEDGIDLIDISEMGEVTFSASGAIGGGTASVWFEAVGGGADTMMRVDINGNGARDGEVRFENIDVALFGENDLILG